MAVGFLQSTSYLLRRASILLAPTDLASWATSPPVLIALSGKRLVPILVTFKLAPGSGATSSNAFWGAVPVIDAASGLITPAQLISTPLFAQAAPVDCSLNGQVLLANQTTGNQFMEMSLDYVEEPPTPT